ncbi:MAG: cupin domain-containing protein, partial [Anaerolineae bacterium]|nr:cupin domain-containing protein [Anaerolineae bacterium]
AENRQQAVFKNALMCNLGIDLVGNGIQAFVVTLAPGGGSGEKMIVHTGYEFVYCLSGSVIYNIEDEIYHLKQGDSIVFESHLPHCWKNNDEGESQLILVISPTDAHETPGGRHFLIE